MSNDSTQPQTDPSLTLPLPGGGSGMPQLADGVPGFRIERELGRGGMGVVYHAIQVRLGRGVALKMILGGSADARETARFLGEAEAVAAVAHPNVVQVYESGEHGGRPYMAMEFVPGGSLADGLREGGRLAPRAAAELVAKIARGVQAAHDLGIVHRDLKPANILLAADGEPKVTDFGLAKRTGRADLTRTGAVMGTPSYMAPEQASGRAKFAGPGADVYALGVILFECLTGRVPFAADDAVALIVKVADEAPPTVREFVPGVPRELESVCLKCLAKTPADRYPTAAELAADLDRVLAGEPPSVSRSSVLGGLFSSLGRGRHAAEFASYAGIFYWLAGLMLATEVVVYLSLSGFVPMFVASGAQFARMGIFVGVVYRYRRGRLLPRTPPERVLWSVWGGYMVTCMAAGLCTRLRVGWAVAEEVHIYPIWCLLAALAYFMLGAGFWGWFYVVGLMFLAAAFVVTLVPAVAPLVFGGLWAVVLLVFARHLHKLAADAK